MIITVEPLTVAAFAPYGDVISAEARPGTEANQGTATRSDWLTSLVNKRTDARANVCVFKSVAKALPFEVKLLEQHPYSSQMFVALKCTRFLVCVAPTAADGGPYASGLRAFVAVPGQGINYNPAVWHHPIIALEGPAEFLMIAHEEKNQQDCIEQQLTESLTVRDVTA